MEYLTYFSANAVITTNESYKKITGVIGIASNFIPSILIGIIGTSFQIISEALVEKLLLKNYKWQSFFIDNRIKYQKDEVKNNQKLIEKESK